MRVIREVVLLTSDRNLRLKALSLNIPARPLRPFVEWSCLKPVAMESEVCQVPNATTLLPSVPPHPPATTAGKWKQQQQHSKRMAQK